jgi:hypothetical protein
MSRVLFVILFLMLLTAPTESPAIAQNDIVTLLEGQFNDLPGVLDSTVFVLPENVTAEVFVEPGYNTVATASAKLDITFTAGALQRSRYFFGVILDDGIEAVDYVRSRLGVDRDWTATRLGMTAGRPQATATPRLPATPRPQATLSLGVEPTSEIGETVIPLELTKWVLNIVPAPVFAAPDRNSLSLLELEVGENVAVTGVVSGEAINNNEVWYQVEIDGQTGYIHTMYLTTDAERAERGTGFVPTIYVVSSQQNINARESADTRSVVVTSISPRSRVQVLDAVDGVSVSNSTVWYEVLIAGEIAYVHSSLLRLETTENE